MMDSTAISGLVRFYDEHLIFPRTVHRNLYLPPAAEFFSQAHYLFQAYVPQH